MSLLRANSRRSAYLAWMSAFGGKADVEPTPTNWGTADLTIVRGRDYTNPYFGSTGGVQLINDRPGLLRTFGRP